MGIAGVQDFSDLFGRRESFLAFLKMQAITLALFTFVAWGPCLAQFFVQQFHVPQEHPFIFQLQEFDRWWVGPQVRLLLYFSTTLSQAWPGPLVGGVLTADHRLLLGLFYAIIGWGVGWVIFRVQEWWSVRLAWLAVGLMTWGAFFQGFTFLFFFVVDSTGRLLATTTWG